MPILWAASVAAPAYRAEAGSARDQHDFLSESPANALLSPHRKGPLGGKVCAKQTPKTGGLFLWLLGKT